MKGITPIIAIIILLLITVALAGSAWMYMSTYMDSIMGKTGEVTSSRCIGTNQAMIIVHNIGTKDLSVSPTGGDVTLHNASSGLPITGPTKVAWQSISGAGITTVSSGSYGVVSTNCTGTCVINVIISGRSQQAIIPC